MIGTISNITYFMKRIGETTTFKDRNLKLQGADIATRKGWTVVPNFIAAVICQYLKPIPVFIL